MGDGQFPHSEETFKRFRFSSRYVHEHLVCGRCEGVKRQHELFELQQLILVSGMTWQLAEAGSTGYETPESENRFAKVICCMPW